MPPRGGDPGRVLVAAESLRGWVHAVNVTDGSRAVMRMSSLAVCRLLLDAGIEPVLQLACRDRNRIALQAELLGAQALGIRNLLCLTGDPVRAGDQPDARPVHELEAVRLLQLVRQFNAGQDPVQGQLPDGPTDLFAGAAADPQSSSWSGLKSRLVRKKEAGARFVQTQMVMDGEALKRFVGEIAAPLQLPVLAGVFLLKSARNAAFINRVVPGAQIPQAVIDRLAAAADPAAEGVAIAAEQGCLPADRPGGALDGDQSGGAHPRDPAPGRPYGLTLMSSWPGRCPAARPWLSAGVRVKSHPDGARP